MVGHQEQNKNFGVEYVVSQDIEYLVFFVHIALSKVPHLK